MRQQERPKWARSEAIGVEVVEELKRKQKSESKQ